MGLKYAPAAWRYGPLHCTNGEVVIGDPLQSCAVVTSESLIYRVAGEIQHNVKWSEISKTHVDLPATKSFLLAHIVDIASALITLVSGQEDGAAAHDPGTLLVKVRGQSDQEWCISSMETGKYLKKYVALTEYFLEQMRTDNALREIAANPDALKHWCAETLAA